MIQYRFNEAKATQAAAHLIKLNGMKMNYLRLLKLLYLADREAIVARGNPITGDRACSMRCGPVLSRVYDLLKPDAEVGSGYWAQFICNRPWYDVGLREDPGDDELSEQEIEWLDDVSAKYQDVDRWTLSRLTHELPEWQNPGRSSIPIQVEDILKSAGYSESDIAEIEEEAQNLRHIDFLAAGGGR